MRVTTEQLGSLRKFDPILYGYVLPVAKGVDGELVEIDESKLVPLQRKLLTAWAKENGIQAPTEHDPKTCVCDTCFQKRVAENNDKEKQRLSLQAQAKAAATRLTQYLKGDVAGFGRLRDNDHNRQQWAAFESKLPADVVLSAELIDRFISGWRQVLEFDAPTPAPAPEPAVRTLPNGEPELSIDANEATMRRASVTQLRDLSKRKGEGKSWFNKAGRSAGNLDTGNQWQVR